MLVAPSAVGWVQSKLNASEMFESAVLVAALNQSKEQVPEPPLIAAPAAQELVPLWFAGSFLEAAE